MKNAVWAWMVAAALLPACGDSGSGVDKDASTDADSDSDTEPQCQVFCESKTTEGSCGGYYEEPEGSADLVLFCEWLELVETTLTADGGCQEGETTGRCHCSGSSEGDDEYPVSVPGCGELAGNPKYVQQGGQVYLALATHPVSGTTIGSCQYDLEGNATPPECGCFCDWPEDPLIACDYMAGVCVDDNTGLMWDADTSQCGAVDLISATNICENETAGGFDDWRLPTIDELRSLIRGCPGNQSGGGCQIGSECTDVSCAEAPCVPCSQGWSYEECDICAGFDEGPCAMCAPVEEQALSGGYRPVEMEISGPIWSATLVTPLPPSTADEQIWFVDFSVGAIEVTSKTGESTEQVLGVECVREP